jgi:hypothetical protein
VSVSQSGARQDLIVLALTLVAAGAGIAALEGRQLFVFLLLIVAAFLGWLGLHRRSWLRVAAWTFAGLLSAASLGLAATSDGRTSQQDQSNQSPTTPTPEAQQTATPTPSEVSSPPPLPPTPAVEPIVGSAAPSALIGKGRTGEFFEGSLIVGIPSVLETFADVAVATATRECSAVTHPGESVVVSGDKSVWYRVWVLEIQPENAAHIRAERIISEFPPAGGSCY